MSVQYRYRYSELQRFKRMFWFLAYFFWSVWTHHGVCVSYVWSCIFFDRFSWNSVWTSRR